MSTRTVILLVDGSADEPIARIGDRTPLMASRKPNIDALAARGCLGTLATVPAGMTPDSAVANLSVLGYDPRTAYQGRGVLEAASLGVDLDAQDMAMRVNVISLEDGLIRDHSCGHITTPEAHALVATLQAELGGDGLEIHPGVSYRHLLVLRGAHHSPLLECAPPHDHVGKPARDLMVRALAPEAEATADRLNRMILASQPILARHPVNEARRAAGKRTADTLWPWAPGRRPTMATLQERFGIRGAVISAVDLIHGLGRYAGMTSIPVEGATGLYNTNYEGKARAALQALEDHDLVFIHVEGPDEAGHACDLGLKIHAIEQVDKRLLGTLQKGIAARGWDDVVYAVLPDHLTPAEKGWHVGEPVPVLIADPRRTPDPVDRFDEEAARQGSLGAMVCADFIETLLRRR